MAMRGIGRISVAVAALVGLLVASAAPVAAADGGTVRGTVTSDGTTPLAGICVSAEQQNDPWDFLGDTVTGADGTYEITGLPAGFYRARFEDCSGDPERASQYDGAAVSPYDGTPLLIGDGYAWDYDGVDAVMPIAGSLGGTVTDEDTGDPLEDVCVWIFSHDESLIVDTLLTDATGSWQRDLLRPADYVIDVGCGEPNSVFLGATVTSGTHTGGLDAAVGAPPPPPGMAVLNDAGGNGGDGNLRVAYAGGQLQVGIYNSGVFYGSWQAPTEMSDSGFFLAVGDVVVGDGFQPWDSVTAHGGSASGSGTITSELRADVGGRTYGVDLTLRYVDPVSVVAVDAEVHVPEGNDEEVRLYHYADTDLYDEVPFLAAGPGSELGVRNDDGQVLAFRARSGPAWDGYFAGPYYDGYEYLEAAVDFPGEVDTDAWDAEIGVNWLVGSTPGSTAIGYDLVLGVTDDALLTAAAPDVLAAGDPAEVTYTIWNDPTRAAKAGLAFSDELPAGTTGELASTTCGGAAAVDGRDVSLAGGVLAAGAASCDVVVEVASAAGGEHRFFGAIHTADDPWLEDQPLWWYGAPVDVAVAATATLTRAFVPAAVALPAGSTLTYTITNDADLGAKADLLVLDQLPAGLVPGDPTSTCDVTLLLEADGILYFQGDLGAGVASCLVELPVTAAEGTHLAAGAGVAVDGPLTFGGADVTLTVTAAPEPDPEPEPEPEPEPDPGPIVVVPDLPVGEEPPAADPPPVVPGSNGGWRLEDGRPSPPAGVPDAPAGAPIAGSPDGNGAWAVAPSGAVIAGGTAAHHGDAAELPLNGEIVALLPTPSGDGYLLVGADGGVFAFGDAAFPGSLADEPLAAPVVGGAMAPGGGTWLLGADGGVFTLGGAPFFGSAAGLPLNAPVIGLVPTATGRGYWLLGADGGVFSFGDATFHGSAAGSGITARALVRTPTGDGYWIVTADGELVPFGAAG